MNRTGRSTNDGATSLARSRAQAPALQLVMSTDSSSNGSEDSPILVFDSRLDVVFDAPYDEKKPSLSPCRRHQSEIVGGHGLRRRSDNCRWLSFTNADVHSCNSHTCLACRGATATTWVRTENVSPDKIRSALPQRWWEKEDYYYNYYGNGYDDDADGDGEDNRNYYGAKSAAAVADSILQMFSMACGMVEQQQQPKMKEDTVPFDEYY